MKRLIDIVGAAVGLVVLAPLLAGLAIVVKLDSPGPTLFLAPRVGRHGRRFRMLKFRSMVVAAPSMSAVLTTPSDDPRITPVGRCLRRYNLDELPQLLNVLWGQMSLVGPRPEDPRYVRLFTERELPILSVRPGMTDLASVWIRDKGKLVLGAEDPERVYLERIRPEKIRLQLEYVRTRSLWLDLKILAWTIGVELERFH